MSAYRCSTCLTNWPPTTEFQACPECDERTSFMGNADPIDPAEALSRKRHADFEKYYADRSAKQLNDELDHIQAGGN